MSGSAEGLRRWVWPPDASARRRAVLSALAAVAGFLSICPPAAAPPAATAASSRQSPAAEYKAIVAKLASAEMEGRGPSTAGIDRARDCLVGHFRAAGLRPAFGASFTQPVQIPMGAKVDKQELAILPILPTPTTAAATGETTAATAPVRGSAGRAASGPSQPSQPSQPAQPARALGRPTTFRPGRDFEAMGFSAGKAFQGEAVFVGYGLADAARQYDSYAGAARNVLAGRVAVVLRYEPQDANGVSLWTRRRAAWSQAAGLIGKIGLAVRHGAAAVLVVNPAGQDSAAVDPILRTAMGPTVSVPVMHISREVFLAMLRAAGNDAAAEARRLQQASDAGRGGPVGLGVTIRGQVALRSIAATCHNVAGVLPGDGDLAREFIVIGAHYDHLGYGFGSAPATGAARPPFYPGADDNASGTAGVVALAGRLARRAAAPSGRAASRPAGRRSILFVAFAGEERGLIGSRHLAGHLGDVGLRPEQVAAMLNLDMIGRLRDGQLGVWGVDTGDRWRQVVEWAAAGTKLKLRLSGSGSGPTDYASFYAIKVPVLNFCTSGHGDLHRPTDTADKINADGALEVIGLVESIVASLPTCGGQAGIWDDPKRIAYVPPGKTPRTAFLGITAGEEAPAGGGCPVESVVPGGPAAAAGVRPGDVIVEWNGRKVADPDDLRMIINHSQPDASVKLNVRRDGKAVTLDVKLGGRG